MRILRIGFVGKIIGDALTTQLCRRLDLGIMLYFTKHLIRLSARSTYTNAMTSNLEKKRNVKSSVSSPKQTPKKD